MPLAPSIRFLTHVTMNRSILFSPAVLRSSVSLLGLLVLGDAAAAQVRSPGTPKTAFAAQPVDLPTHVVPPMAFPSVTPEEAAHSGPPMRYGEVIPVALDSSSSGLWDVASDGTLVWRLRIVSRGAHSLGLEFSDFHLEPGASLFLYDETRQTVFGAYTEENHRPDGGFVIEPFPGESVILELDVPSYGNASSHLAVSGVVHDYVGIFELENLTSGGPTGSFAGNCLIDVNCPQGDPWGTQKRSTVRTLSAGALCSASLMNNTANDGIVYVLSANHCGQNANTTFRFNYQLSGCGTGSAPNQTVSGATVLATNSTFDNRFMRMTGTIPASYNAYLAGWSRSTTNPSYAFSMGHPSGGVKKISIDANGAIRESSFWRVTWSEGTLEGGSSGGPLFDQNGRVIGPACCVDAFNCNQTAWYGRFDRFWTTQAIGQWLDPLGLNPTSIDGMEAGGGTPPVVTAVIPSTIDRLVPGTDQTVAITGSGFSSGTITLDVDGTNVPSGFTVVTDNLITLDFPDFAGLGLRTITVHKGAFSDSGQITVVANASATIQVGNGDDGNPVSSGGVPLSVAGPLGQIQLLIASPSPVPSNLPGKIHLDLGAGFSQTTLVGSFLVNAGGLTLNNLSFPGITGIQLYFQSLEVPLPFHFPMPESNLQHVSVL